MLWRKTARTNEMRFFGPLAGLGIKRPPSLASSKPVWGTAAG
jgi:hypothetical protein